MKKFLNCLVLFTLPFCYCAAQADTTQVQTADSTEQGIDTLEQRIVLVGDAGELHNGQHPVVDWLRKNVDWNDERNLLVYLGDNIYPLGLPTEGEPSYPEAKKIIDYQINLVRGKKSRAYFIPGNHDWKNGKLGGWQQILNQVDYINGQQLDNVQAWPTDGCPGPIEVEVNDKVVMVLMDSQWFLYVHEKPGPSSNCPAKTIDEFATELGEIAATHQNQLLVLAMHHPMYSYGPHGGDYTWRHHVFPFTEYIPWLYIPLPVLGSVYPVARGVFGNIQDIRHPIYKNMARTIEDVLRDHPNTIVAAGHEHSLQLIRKDSIPYIVSGSGINLTRVKKNAKVEFESVSMGFSTIEVRKSGKVDIRFYNINSKNLDDPIYAGPSKPIITTEPKGTIDTLLPLKDFVTVSANTSLTGSKFKHMLMGRNYRSEWTYPVTVPVLDLGKEYGGLKPERQGGGKQTKSLRLEDSTGKEWVLRSIEKFPEAAMPAELRGGLAKDVVEDGISASYPYGSLSIAPLAHATGLPHIRRRLVYVPDDPRLDRFKNEFSNTLAILEEREPLYVTKTYNTNELVLRLAKDNDDHVDQKYVLKARLLDNFIMDFDRHEDQWRWATRDTGKGKIYYPIPRDHDQAFFTNQGLIPKFARKPWFIPEIQGFRAKAKNINTFNRVARNFDRTFLSELTEEDWRRQIDTFLTAMTDQVIEQSMQNQPKEIHQFSMNPIMETLKRRRDYFRNDMMRYYRFISREVRIVGSNQREQFIITKQEDGNVRVVVNKIDKSDAISSKIYDRVFQPRITEELQIYGLNDDDRYLIEGGDAEIKIRIIGGAGNDTFINNGNGGKVLIYDAVYENNAITGNPGLRDKISNDPQVNRYERLSYKYDYINPGVTMAYNIDDGLFLGAQVEAIENDFRKEPYKMRHFVRVTRALQTASFRVRYEGDFTKLIGNKDLLLRADIRAPINVTNYFGYGNATVFDKTKPGREQFYRVRYDLADVSVLLRRQMQSWMRVHYGPTVQVFQVEDQKNAGRFVSQTSINGLNPETLYDRKFYAGAHFKLDINSQNNRIVPTRGLVMDVNMRPLFGLTGSSKNLMRADIDMRIFASLFKLPRIVLATRAGYGRIIGNFELPQAYYLSGVENLRGYRRDRFAGRTMFFNNTELRFKVANFYTYLFPGELGFFVFNDVGRVWMDNEESKDWHVGNGAGVYLAPVKRFVITAAITRSKEEKALPLVTFGFQF